MVAFFGGRLAKRMLNRLHFERSLKVKSPSHIVRCSRGLVALLVSYDGFVFFNILSKGLFKKYEVFAFCQACLPNQRFAFWMMF